MKTISESISYEACKVIKDKITNHGWADYTTVILNDIGKPLAQLIELHLKKLDKGGN